MEIIKKVKKENGKKCYYLFGVEVFSIKKKTQANHTTLSYSQLGEDLIVESFVSRDDNVASNGFYVDIGAHHPTRYSNTKFFYDKGWSGINVEPMSDVIELFNKERERDINLNIAISKKEGMMKYYNFSDHAVNTLSKEVADKIINNPDSHFKLIDTKDISVMPLGLMLDKHLPQGKEIDFMNVDVEGLDLVVLQSNNWDKYKPKYILIEIHNAQSMEDVVKTDLYKYLSQKNYALVGKTYCTCLFNYKR